MSSLLQLAEGVQNAAASVMNAMTDSACFSADPADEGHNEGRTAHELEAVRLTQAAQNVASQVVLQLRKTQGVQISSTNTCAQTRILSTQIRNSSLV
jgi:hypothetical protein